MDYIKKNFEKVILSVLLILFVLALFWVISIFGTVASADLLVKTRAPEARINFADKVINAEYNLSAQLSNNAVITAIEGARTTRSGLLSPVPMAICPNPVGPVIEVTDPKTGKVEMQQKLCDQLIPRSMFTDGVNCHYCGGALHEPTKRVIIVDSDGDGIPDDVERQLGLDPADSNDAYEDMDADGFSNIVEYLGQADSVDLDRKSDMSDAKSHPSLAYRLYLSEIKQTLIPLTVKKVEAYGDNKVAWSALIEFSHPKGKRTEYVAIGKSIKVKNETYTVVDIIPNVVKQFDPTVKREMKVDVSVVVLDSKSYKAIKAVVKKKVFEPAKKATMIDVANNKSYRVRLSDPLSLGDETVGLQNYTVKVIDDVQNIVTIASGDGKSAFIVKDQENAPKISGGVVSTDESSDGFEPTF